MKSVRSDLKQTEYLSIAGSLAAIYNDNGSKYQGWIPIGDDLLASYRSSRPERHLERSKKVTDQGVPETFRQAGFFNPADRSGGKECPAYGRLEGVSCERLPKKSSEKRQVLIQ